MQIDLYTKIVLTIIALGLFMVLVAPKTYRVQLDLGEVSLNLSELKLKLVNDNEQGYNKYLDSTKPLKIELSSSGK